MRISDRTRIRWGKTLAGTSVAVGLIGTGMLVLGGEGFSSGAFHVGLWAVGVGSLAWITIGTQAKNRVIWTLAWAGFFAALANAGFAVFRLTAPASLQEIPLEEIFTLSPSDLPNP